MEFTKTMSTIEEKLIMSLVEKPHNKEEKIIHENSEWIRHPYGWAKVQTPVWTEVIPPKMCGYCG